MDAELMIDHSWGLEPCTIRHIKEYKSSVESMSSGQVLKCGYNYEQTRVIVREMAEEVIHRLISTEMVAEGITIHIGYDYLRTADGDYSGPTKVNHYGKTVPKSARGTADLGGPTSTPSRILKATMELFEKIMDKRLCSKRIHVTAIRLSKESDVPPQLGFFTDIRREKREKDLVMATLNLQNRFGKNAVFKAYDMMECATTLERNLQIGGHRA